MLFVEVRSVSSRIQSHPPDDAIRASTSGPELAVPTSPEEPEAPSAKPKLDPQPTEGTPLELDKTLTFEHHKKKTLALIEGMRKVLEAADTTPDPPSSDKPHTPSVNPQKPQSEVTFLDPKPGPQLTIADSEPTERLLKYPVQPPPPDDAIPDLEPEPIDPPSSSDSGIIEICEDLKEEEDDGPSSTPEPGLSSGPQTPSGNSEQDQQPSGAAHRLLKDLTQIAKNKIVEPPEPAIAEWLLKAVDGNLLFARLNPDQRKVVIEQMFREKVAKNDEIITQGDKHADTFYVVEQGTFDIIVNGDHVATYGPGKCFGELALLYDAPRAATVKATKNAVVWTVRRSSFYSTGI